MLAHTGPMEPASTVYEAALVDHLGWRDRADGAIHPGLADELMAEEQSMVDLVVRRKEDGAELIRTPADIGAPESLLTAARADLEAMTVEEFKREWRMPSGKSMRRTG